MTQIRIAYLYPNEMNIYGDRGNILVLRRRLEWRGYKVKVDEIEPGIKYDFNTADIIFGGGGQDRGQLMIAQDLLNRSESLHRAVNNKKVLLAICGTYQLLGKAFITSTNERILGIGIFDATTKASEKRLIGNVVVKTPFGRFVGFENHSGQTILSSSQRPLGTVIKGYGNNCQDDYEGAVTNNAFGTYMHGPILSKSSLLADELILRALSNRGINWLEKIDNELEEKATFFAEKRID
jgi:lipid II isoglutaminyl synthase (glutamine-hydrolysing)